MKTYYDTKRHGIQTLQCKIVGVPPASSCASDF